MALRAGYAAGEITLPAGTEMAGFIARLGPCVQALRLGPIAVVGLPGGIFSTIGAAIKAGSPLGAAHTLLANLSNDNVGYVPDRGAYGVAGYETDVASRSGGHPAAWAPEVGERLVEAGIGALQATVGKRDL